jgi:ABC-type iron transport system FetAB ATPase subunit
MDETVKLSGTSTIKGRIAYVEQEPFIFSATIEENIIFGFKFNEKRFKHAVKIS